MKKLYVHVIRICVFVYLSTTTALLSVQAFNNEVKVSIPVTKNIAGDVSGIEETYTFILKPDEPGNPLPDTCESVYAEIIVNNEGTASFGDIIYREEGIYTYTVYEEQGNNTNCIYDDMVYRVTVSVVRSTGGLEAVLVFEDEAQYKTEALTFVNVYQGANETEQSENRPEEKEESGTPVKTGDSTLVLVWISVSAAAAGVLRGLWFRRNSFCR